MNFKVHKEHEHVCLGSVNINNNINITYKILSKTFLLCKSAETIGSTSNGRTSRKQ